ncbi:hypothetical protein B0T24DRAFT_677887 [Lasiosphaeria ovina]|uniref:Uncharacterized protein n=1 Tax=Lasiosphaeria ovina TaxID=92902 RepID=A0AAE0KI58_9PEZI|nr:hypothetical protein B0T24DRAFT_677887 [Lasiosphaeria ovina]
MFASLVGNLGAAFTHASKPSTPPPPIIVLPGPIPPGAEARFSNLRTQGDYLLAALVPVLLTTLLSIAVQVFVSRLSAMLPFRALSHGCGATAEISLFLSRCSGLLTLPLISARCVDGPATPAPRACAFGLRQSGAAMRAAEGLLGLLAALVIAAGVLLARWRTSVGAEPWSIANIAALVAHDRNGGGHPTDVIAANGYTKGTASLRAVMEHVPQVLALMLLAGLLVLVLYYENTMLDTAFQAFINGQSFGTADALYLATAVAALLAKFMPTLLSNIPFRNTVT